MTVVLHYAAGEWPGHHFIPVSKTDLRETLMAQGAFANGEEVRKISRSLCDAGFDPHFEYSGGRSAGANSGLGCCATKGSGPLSHHAMKRSATSSGLG